MKDKIKKLFIIIQVVIDYVGWRSIFGSLFFAAIIFCVIGTNFFRVPVEKLDGTRAQYYCDQKLFSPYLNLDVKVVGEDELLYNIKGEFSYPLYDNLTMTNSEGNKIGYSDDEYNSISQNDHYIFIDNELRYHFDGKIKHFADRYEVYNTNEEVIATAYFGSNKEKGYVLVDLEGNVLAEYGHSMFSKDFVVSIYENCPIDDRSVILMFASYHSDARADADEN